MIKFKKFLPMLMASVLLTTSAHADVVYENITETTITKGVTHQAVEYFSETGWRKADIVRIDLTDENLEVKVLTAPEGSSRVATVKTMAEHYNTKAAINGDFFNFSSGETNMLGMVYQDGELISTPSKDNFVSFAITEDNQVIFDYFTFQGTLYAENTSLTEESSCELYQINKVPLTTGAITMLTPAWGETVKIPDYCFAMVCEPYEEDSYKMVSLSWGSESVAIPEDGAVFTANYSVNGFLNENFAVGDVIRVETSISPDVDSIKEATGGNTLIVKDGEVCEFTSEIKGLAQRSALGISPSGKTLVFVTIDGRQVDSAGVNQTLLAEFMIALGCDTAINLDGGGSTTMVTEDRFSSSQIVQNDVVSLRKVSTAIGVLSHRETGAVKFGEVKVDKDTIILGDSVNLQYVFSDKNYNKAEIDPEKVKISCSDPYAIIDFDRVMPTSPGTHQIWVEYENIELETSVTVLGDIFAINLYPEVINAKTADRVLTVTAYDRNGHSAPVPTHLVSFVTEGDVIIENNIVKKGEGSGTVTAMYENLTSVGVVNAEKHLRPEDVKATDTFEGFIENGEKITLSGKISESKNLLGKLQVRERIEDLITRGDVYTLSDVNDHTGKFIVYKTAEGFTERTIENSKIVTIPNTTDASFWYTDTYAWSKIKNLYENITEKNLVLMTNEPIYNMPANEQIVFDYYMQKFIEKGVNVFVVSPGEKSEVTVKDGVRYLYIGAVGNTMNASYDYVLNTSSPLTFTFSGDEIKYTFESIKNGA